MRVCETTRCLRYRWIRPTGNWRPAREERDWGAFFVVGAFPPFPPLPPLPPTLPPLPLCYRRRRREREEEDREERRGEREREEEEEGVRERRDVSLKSKHTGRVGSLEANRFSKLEKANILTIQ